MSSATQKKNSVTFTVWSVVILIVCVLYWLVVPENVSFSIWLMLVLFLGASWMAGLAYVYTFRLDSNIIVNPDSKDSTNYPAPVTHVRGLGIFGGLEVWGRHGFNSDVFAWKDSKYDIYSAALAPKPLAPGSRVFVTPALLHPISDAILTGVFPTVRDNLMTNPNSSYNPRKPSSLFAALLHVIEADYETTQEFDAALVLGALVASAREISKSPEKEATKIIKSIETAVNKKSLSSRISSLLGGGQEKDEDAVLEEERGREGALQ